MQFKYDKRENRIFKLCSIVFAVLFIVSVIVTIVEDNPNVGAVGVISFLLSLSSPILLIASLCGFIDSSLYIKKLKKGGIDVPENKKEDPSLPGQPVYREEEQDSTESLIMALICTFIVIGLGIYMVVYLNKWLSLGVYDCKALAFIQLVIILFWCAGGVFFFIQRSKKHYRDDTVFDPGRKERMGIVKGIVTIALCLLITLAAERIIVSMTDYVYKSRLESIYGDQWRTHVGESLRTGQ